MGITCPPQRVKMWDTPSFFRALATMRPPWSWLMRCGSPVTGKRLALIPFAVRTPQGEATRFGPREVLCAYVSRAAARRARCGDLGGSHEGKVRPVQVGKMLFQVHLQLALHPILDL